MRKTVLIVLAVVVACAVLVAFTRSRNSGKTADAGAGNAPQQAGGRGARGGMGSQVIPVAVAPATQQDMPVYLSGLGSVQAFYTVTVKTRVDGEVRQVYFKEGQDVKKGDPLVEIDPRPYQVALEQAEATLLKDQSQLTIAQRNFQRYQDLYKQGVVARTDLDAQESNFGALNGQVKADQAAVDNAKLNLAYCHITAPIQGRVGLRQVDPGNMVHASDATGLLVITQLRPITALFTIPEDTLPQVMQAEHKSKKPLEVDAFSRDNQTKLATGSLTTVNNQIDPTTGTVRLKAVFDNTDGLLWPNQFVNARLLLDVKKNAVVIPAAAIQRGTQGTFVFVVGQDGTAQIRPVKVGVSNGDLLAVDSGLAPGEQVVTDGQDKLQAGSKVQAHAMGGASGNPPGGAPGGRGQHTSRIPVGM
ncbi:MAG: MdtA/MuxA family multidrug efflux RND transporter periplasmic adaptor subunit [Terriglobales bacterium]